MNQTTAPSIIIDAIMMIAVTIVDIQPPMQLAAVQMFLDDW